MADPFAQPTDVQLLEEYLRPRVDTGKSPSPLFHSADVYAAHPEDLTSEYAPVTSRDGATRWYFFTELREKSRRDSRTRRLVASGGSWHGEHQGKPVFAGVGGPKIGYHTTLTFCRKELIGERPKHIRLGWIMSEVGFCDGGGQGRTRVVVYRLYRSPRTAPATAPGTARGSRPPNQMAGDAPPRRSLTQSPIAAEGSPGATEVGVPASSRTAEGPRAGGARAAEGPRVGGARSAEEQRAGGARSAEGLRGDSQPEVPGGARAEEGPWGDSEPEEAGGARTTDEGPRGDSEPKVSGNAASSGCSCGQDRREIVRLEHSAARSGKVPCKVMLIAQVEAGDGEASPDDFLLHRLCQIEWIEAAEGLASSRKRKREERSGWLVLGPAKAAVVPNSVCTSCSRCGEQLSP